MAKASKYTKILAEEICAKLASGDSLRTICASSEMPDKATIMRWLLSESPLYAGFRDQYALARKIQAENLADELFDITDNGSNDWMEKNDKDGNKIYVVNGEHVNRSRLRIDARKWYLSKVLPRFKDDKTDNSVGADAALVDTLSKLIDKLPN